MTGVLMIFNEHPAFVPPEMPECKLWRYMDFTKFVSMLATQSLYFTSLRKMSEQDPFEGLLPDRYFECRSWKTVEDIPEHQRWRLTSHVPAGQNPLDVVKSQLEDFAKTVFHYRKMLYVNCWHMSNYDSAAMWSIYASRGSGIAITSNYASLQAAFQSDKPLFGGKINYADYSTDVVTGDLSNNILTTATRKRLSFDFEREFRVVFWDDSVVKKPGLEELVKIAVPDGMEFLCNLSTLIDEVYVSPKSEIWFLRLVQSVVQTYGLTKEVRRSALDVHPIL
jgi:hypothetical protein